MHFEKMNIVFQVMVLLLGVGTIFSADTSRTVLFPDLSEENSEEFDYGAIDVSQTASQSKLSSTKTIKFRIDSTDVPCVNTTMYFCEEVTNQAYPKQYVESMLAKTDAQTYKNYFNKTLPKETLRLRSLSTNNEPIELCDSFKRVIHPQLARSVHREWHFVINQPSYQQPILMEICRKKKSKCLFSESQSMNYVSLCVQKYTKVPLLSLREDGQMVSYDYEFPGYCQCEIQPRKSIKRQRF
ncbi:uncharacterized protein LOC129569403 [Sitodiplosis mosellana]|uniref:uncharacterized protein LOC129569403 n=1 Tax=Sitodiplosis mosellana TaxID=263140 RepID=UPI002443C292|nr:uncharacterized protein LOC129569403 [Sitodiplosis mosellana]